MTVFLTKLNKAENAALKEFKEYMKIDEYTHDIYVSGTDQESTFHGKILALEVNDINWYPVYSHVKSWTNLMEEAEIFGLMYELVAIGEDGEVTRESSADNNCLIETSITANIKY
jgi:endo-1,4-beta-mannosidase